MMLPQGYGMMPQKAVRKGYLNGGIIESIAQAQSAIATYDQQAKELERTQKQLQSLIAVGYVVMGIGGSYLVYRFLQEMGKAKNRK